MCPNTSVIPRIAAVIDSPETRRPVIRIVKNLCQTNVTQSGRVPQTVQWSLINLNRMRSVERVSTGEAPSFQAAGAIHEYGANFGKIRSSVCILLVDGVIRLSSKMRVIV